MIALSCHFALARLCAMIHWTPLSMEFLVWCGTIASLQSKAGFRIRLPAEKVLVCGRAMFLKVSQFQEVGLAISYTVHRALLSRSRSFRHSSSLVCQLDEPVAMFPYAGAERFTSFLWIQDSILPMVLGMSNGHSVFLWPGHDLRSYFKCCVGKVPRCCFWSSSSC